MTTATTSPLPRTGGGTLRAADAVQLASCLLLRDRATSDIRLTTADHRLAAAAEAEDVRVELVA